MKLFCSVRAVGSSTYSADIALAVPAIASADSTRHHSSVNGCSTRTTTPNGHQATSHDSTKLTVLIVVTAVIRARTTTGNEAGVATIASSVPRERSREIRSPAVSRARLHNDISTGASTAYAARSVRCACLLIAMNTTVYSGAVTSTCTVSGERRVSAAWNRKASRNSLMGTPASRGRR